MTRLAKDVTRLARLGAFGTAVPPFFYGIAFSGALLSDSHLLWSLVWVALVVWSWHQSVGWFRTMYSTGRFDGAATAWAEATEECDTHHHCRICGGHHE